MARNNRRDTPIHAAACRICWLLLLPLALMAQSGAVRAQWDLPALIQAALSGHPSLRAQSGMYEAAQAGVGAARWQYWPTPSLAVESAAAGSPYDRNGDKTVTTLGLQQPVWTGGRLTGNLRKAEAEAQAFAADLEATRRQLSLRVIQAWSDAAAAQGKLAAYEQSHAVHARLLALVERRTLEGASAQADIDLARSRLETTDADLSAARAQFDTALDNLRLLTGRAIDADDLSLAAEATHPALAPTLDQLILAAREQSPQVARAEAQTRIAEAEVALARASLSPEVYVRAERRYGNYAASGESPDNAVFIGVTTYLGGGLSSLSALNAATSRLRAAEADILSQRLASDEQVQNDHTLYRMSEMRGGSLARASRTSADVFASWERQFLAGRKQWQDLMNAIREQTQYDAQLADAVAARQLTGWRLAVLTQGVDAVLPSPSALAGSQ